MEFVKDDLIVTHVWGLQARRKSR